jgi:microcystin-dependent protein
MALNFPNNPTDKQIHIDPASGLKYIFNGSVGGWETAIQPPVITSTDEEPSIKLEGFLWWNHPDRMLYVYKGGDWIPIMTGGGSGFLGVPVVCAPYPPEYAREGWLWWHSIEGNLYVYYCDEPDHDVEGAVGSCQWVITNTAASDGGAEALAIVSDIQPQSPKDGQIWYNSGTGALWVYDAEDPGSWNEVTGGSGGGSGGGGSSGGGSITGTTPITVTSPSGTTNISIKDATTTQKGAVRFAKSGDEGSNNVALTPAFLKSSGGDMIPDATETIKGVVRLATDLDDSDGVVTAAVLDRDADSAGFSNPVGTIIMFASELPPAGYLLCNGDVIQSGMTSVQGMMIDTTKLHSVLGTSYSTNSNVKLPDARGNFIRGFDAGANQDADPSRQFGEYQSDSVRGGTPFSANTGTTVETEESAPQLIGTSVNQTNTYTSETRPKNITVSYCIKY